MIVLHKLLISVNRGRAVSSSVKITVTKVRNIMSASFEATREKLENGIYSLHNIPGVLFMDFTGVYVSEDAPYPDIVEALERSRSGTAEKKNVLTPKLRATSYGDWYSRVVMMHSGHFESRNRLDELLMKTSDREVGPQCITVNSISLQAALKTMMVDLSINMEHYLQNTCEIDAELGYKISDCLELNNELLMRKLEQELFYKMMCKLFGKEIAGDQIEVDGKETLYEKSFVIRDFSILSFDGNSMLATATRDDYYLLLFFDY